MSEYTLCKNGHYYLRKLDKCPYCPLSEQETAQNPLKKTQVLDSSENSLKRTQELVPENDLRRTRFLPSEQPMAEPSPQRRLVGWLVSFSQNPQGQDFRLFEGKTRVGSSPSCDLRLEGAEVSGHHLTLLFRRNEFLFKDELSTNGTFLNGKFAEEGRLRDGDLLRVGQHELRLRTLDDKTGTGLAPEDPESPAI